MNIFKALMSALIASFITALFHHSYDTVFLAFMLTFYDILILDKLAETSKSKHHEQK